VASRAHGLETITPFVLVLDFSLWWLSGTRIVDTRNMFSIFLLQKYIEEKDVIFALKHPNLS
jgi:hypothetical protein